MNPILKSLGKSWYKEIWSLDIKNQSWVENTADEVDFIIKTLKLNGTEKILDMACGFGRHSLEFARRGYEVVGVDITKDYVEDAIKSAKQEALENVAFIQADLRELNFESEFDVVLNLADGAIGYLENENENSKIFDQIERALKPGGKHFMEIANAEYADHHFPCTAWDIGEKAISLSKFEWDREKRIYIFGSWDFVYGEVATKPEFEYGTPLRIYTIEELKKIMDERGMNVISSFCDYYGKAASCNDFQLMLFSVKKP